MCLTAMHHRRAWRGRSVETKVLISIGGGERLPRFHGDALLHLAQCLVRAVQYALCSAGWHAQSAGLRAHCGGQSKKKNASRRNAGVDPFINAQTVVNEGPTAGL